MDRQALKLLAQALRQRQSEQEAPVDTSNLPPLPDLSMTSLQTPSSDPTPQSANVGNLYLNRHGLNFKSDNVQAQLSPDKIQAQLSIRDALVKALYNKDGNGSVNASMPALGGNLDIGYSRNTGNNSYNVKYQKSF